jgi:hypothetical protein
MIAVWAVEENAAWMTDHDISSSPAIDRYFIALDFSSWSRVSHQPRIYIPKKNQRDRYISFGLFFIHWVKSTYSVVVMSSRVYNLVYFMIVR